MSPIEKQVLKAYQLACEALSLDIQVSMGVYTEEDRLQRKSVPIILTMPRSTYNAVMVDKLGYAPIEDDKQHMSIDVVVEK